MAVVFFPYTPTTSFLIRWQEFQKILHRICTINMFWRDNSVGKLIIFAYKQSIFLSRGLRGPKRSYCDNRRAADFPKSWNRQAWANSVVPDLIRVYSVYHSTTTLLEASIRRPRCFHKSAFFMLSTIFFIIGDQRTINPANYIMFCILEQTTDTRWQQSWQKELGKPEKKS